VNGPETGVDSASQLIEGIEQVSDQCGRHVFSLQKRLPRGCVHAMDLTVPQSTRRAAPLLAEARGLHTWNTITGVLSIH
jgi:hypothetical protein